MQESFSKCYRLLSRDDFLYLKDGAFAFKLSGLRVYYKKSRLNLKETRAGFIVTKKIGNAIKRNIFKRVLRETFRKSAHKDCGIDAVFVVQTLLADKEIKLAKKILSDSMVAALTKIANES